MLVEAAEAIGARLVEAATDASLPGGPVIGRARSVVEEAAVAAPKLLADALGQGKPITNASREAWTRAVVDEGTSLEALVAIHQRWRDVLFEEVAQRAATIGVDDARLSEVLGLLSGALDSSLLRSAQLIEEQRRELTARLTAERERLEEQVLVDPLTGLANRAGLLRRLGEAISSAKRADLAPAVLFCDLDRFKLVNDAHGHAVGDEVLMEVARRLGAVFRLGDTIGRIGGDEFVVVIDRSQGARGDAAQLGSRVVDVLAEPFRTGAGELYLSASLGLAEATPGDEPDLVLGRADRAMYLAKEGGRGRLVAYEPEMDEAVVRRAGKVEALRRALEHDGLSLHFQPIRRLEPEQVRSMEALVRWEDPAFGSVGAQEVVALAEEAGLLPLLDQFVLGGATMLARQWRDGGARDVKVCVNVAGSELADAGLVGRVKRALEHSGLEPDALCLEVAEVALADRQGVLAGRIRDLKELGVGVAIDRFGSGGSALSHLTTLEVDMVKLDRSIVSQLPTSEAVVALASAVVNLASQLGLEVVAVGVERPEELAALRSIGCGAAQGFLLGRPAPFARSEANVP
jgi:diguanylate cyclase (GGDEF)-like protein